ncbi:CGNR zinc finger domain-containing protein [Herbiconiux sp. KACC 21604]|uniref:CGNR zinc finger domain-containing protein n=1 Tax=unclassified Herbiconiux TaxID=2618217 RepID=UPI001492CC45|nr:CGNR zinc finger domain-containing protein [Herbiconiux sp. SALV-R1]QJU54640.1 CGNR zinc finger domain-containing protein [Herbiconiux sp. SALV-R1]WPO85738.1 CGNR zinc finger domain-containing protein [Herbiconiux sp. KACC 21604]
MHLNPYGEYAVLLAQSLADDWPADRDGVVDRTREYGMTMPFPEQAGDHDRCRNVVDQWLAVVDAPDADHRAALLNEQMATVSAYPRLTDHHGEGWHLHYRDIDDDLPLVLHSVFAVGTALHLSTRGIDRLGRCASAPCRKVIVDTSRNGTQRYCSPRCASRDAVRRHRARATARES